MFNVIIPAAGLGTRMRPLSRSLSKTLIPLNGKPILGWILDNFHSWKCYDDISEIVIVANDSGDISRFIDTYSGLDIRKKIKVVQQRFDFNGPGGAILSGVSKLTHPSVEDGLLIWLSDTISQTDFSSYIEKGVPFIATAKVPVETSSRWCVYVDDQFLNKPSPVYFSGTNTLDALIGVYYMPSLAGTSAFSFSEYQEYKNTGFELNISYMLTNYRIDKQLPFQIVDDTEQWCDTGELDSFYKTKAKLLTLGCRAQSTLCEEDGVIYKTGNTDNAREKIAKEKQWYLERKGFQKLFVPKLLDDKNDDSLAMEVCPGTALADIVAYENVPVPVMGKIILRAVEKYHENFIDVAKGTHHPYFYLKLVNEFYWRRTIRRIAKNYDLYKSLSPDFELTDYITIINYIADFCDDITDSYETAHANNGFTGHLINTKEENAPNIHGDFHLGNILFDSLINKYTFLDPRGGTMYKSLADSYYDIAKIYHDVYCGYFLILKNLCKVEKGIVVFSDYYQEYLNYFQKILDNYLTSVYSYDMNLVRRLSVIQLLTCIPFHTDNINQCKLFLTRALNLIKGDAK